MFELLLLYVAALVCGAGNKYADLFNEHGLNVPYKHAEKVWGIIWGVAGAYLVYANSTVAMIYIATTLYWFLRVKLEYFNHAFAGVLMLLAGFYFQSTYIIEHKNSLIFLFLAFTVTGYIQKYLKETTTKLWWFWKLRLRIYLIPLLYSFVINDYTPFLITLVAMVGNEWVRYYFRRYENDHALLRNPQEV